MGADEAGQSDGSDRQANGAISEDGSPEPRIGVLIDAENIFHSAKALYRRRVNYRNLLDLIVGNRRLARAVAYVVMAREGDALFFDALVRLGIEVKVRQLQIYGRHKKGDWDVGITVDAVRMSDELDTVVLVTGDGDFVELVDYLHERNRRVEIAAFRPSASGRLVRAVDRFINLSDDPMRYLL